MKQISKNLIAYFSCLLFGYAIGYFSAPHPSVKRPVVPTVFTFSKENKLGYEEKKNIIDTARGILGVKDDAFSENIIIIDDGDSWFVSFNSIGNGMFWSEGVPLGSEKDYAPGHVEYFEDKEKCILLNKRDLTPNIGRKSFVWPAW